ncbi:retinal-specific ATP-binding cassette transporter-like isoform X5 [Varroa destructor]|uniref:ABC transporter domain-containing protein n=1 Tax=Varroa destructor TaxID=109461 RepID=A0A7M7L6X2_VARDE|nr:retinal-specific ATP-binding cassette transporter-like isoform X5 [Varroa destructor]
MVDFRSFEKRQVTKRLRFGRGCLLSATFKTLRLLIPAGQPARSSSGVHEGAMGYWRQLWAIYYKDFFIRKIKRHYIFATLEVIVPITLLSLLVYLRYCGTKGVLPYSGGPETYPQSPDIKIIVTEPSSKVAVAPNNTYTQHLLQRLVERSGMLLLPQAYPSWEELKYSIKESNSTLIALNMERVSSTRLDYVISIDAPRQVSSKGFPISNDPRNVSETMEPYILYPLIWNIFEHFADYFYAEPMIAPTLQPQPAAGYLTDYSFDQLSRFISQFLLFSYVVLIGVYPMQIIQEKASRIRELLRMSGQPEMVYWHGIFLTGMTSMTFVAVLATVLFALPVKGYPLLIKSSPFAVFLVLMTFSLVATLQLILISVLFNGPTMGAMVSILFWFLPLTLCTVLIDSKETDNYFSTDASVKLLTAMLPTCGCYWAFKIICFWESANVGLQFNNLADIATPGDNISMLSVLLTFLLTSLILAFLIFYLDAVLPWQYGIPKEPLFLFRKAYWIDVHERRDSFIPRVEDPTMFEPPPPNLEPFVVVDSITKVFGNKKVVDDLSVRFYKNQISVILGHNGAGKTTTMNILTGLFPPTSGDIFINGYSIRKDTKQARKSIGLCPQHNVLFDDLTVEEHLQYFAIIKNTPSFNGEIVELLTRFNLLHKRSTLAKDLSGGMKRKLSMANAMVGGSELLILDEPTAGMDPQARREIWSILQDARKTRTILLTTHYMEEADVLGDRIAFLAHGRLKCVGSPMFLKRKFNTGYKMRVAKAYPGHRSYNILDVVTSHVRGAVVEANMNHEIVFNLGFPPTEELVTLFHHLEDNKKRYGIATLGVAVTTMEDVFLKVGSADEDQNNSSSSQHSPRKSYERRPQASENTERFPRFRPIYGGALTRQQFRALFVKRFNSIKRQWWMPLLLFVLPLTLTYLFCVLDEWAYRHQIQITRTYSMKSIYGSTKSWFSSVFPQNSSRSIFKHLEAALLEEDVSNTVIPQQDFEKYLLSLSEKDPLAYRRTMMMGVAESKKGIELWVNDQPYLSAPSALIILQRAMLKKALKEQVTVEAATDPRDSTNVHTATLLKLIWVRFVAVFPISLATAFLTCSIVLNPIQENISKAKLVQLMSGVSQTIYFGASFVFDGILLVVSCVCMLAIMLIYNPLESFRVFDDTWGSVIVVVMAMLDMLSMTKHNLFKLDVDALAFFLQAFNYIPSFSVVWGFVNIHVNGLSRDFCKDNRKIMDEMCNNSLISPFVKPCCHSCEPANEFYQEGFNFCYVHTSPFAFQKRDGAGFQMLALFIVGTVLFAVLIFMESNAQRLFCFAFDKMNKLRRKSFGGYPNANSLTNGEDDDVHKERYETERLVRLGVAAISTEALVAHGLTKDYGRFRAVDNISFRVHEQECFGLLGVNGAGKTTTFGMLTGDLMCTEGNAYIKDTNIRKNVQKFQKHIGYCPQGDALIDKMTGREMLHLYCALRGVPPNLTEHLAAFIIDVADLEAHADKTTDSYSGGTKRKLSIALTLTGNPTVMFLDEPTAGVDPSARRKIWRTLLRAQRDMGSAIVLTSHSMEECEALCHRMCIMVNGRFRCIGSTQQLKSKYGEGFTVLIKLAIGHEYQANEVVELMKESFPGHVILRENYQSLLHFQVTDTSLRWSVLFQRVNDINKMMLFEDVIVSDTTLEQIFISFAKTQRRREEDLP